MFNISGAIVLVWRFFKKTFSVFTTRWRHVQRDREIWCIPAHSKYSRITIQTRFIIVYGSDRGVLFQYSTTEYCFFFNKCYWCTASVQNVIQSFYNVFCLRCVAFSRRPERSIRSYPATPGRLATHCCFSYGWLFWSGSNRKTWYY